MVYAFVEFYCWLVLPLPQPGKAGISNGGQEPGAPILSLKGVKGTERAQISFLHEVLSVVRVASQPAGEIECRIEMRNDGLFKKGQSPGRIHTCNSRLRISW